MRSCAERPKALGVLRFMLYPALTPRGKVVRKPFDGRSNKREPVVVCKERFVWLVREDRSFDPREPRSRQVWGVCQNKIIVTSEVTIYISLYNTRAVWIDPVYPDIFFDGGEVSSFAFTPTIDACRAATPRIRGPPPPMIQGGPPGVNGFG